MVNRSVLVVVVYLNVSHHLDRLLDVIVVNVHLEGDLARLAKDVGVLLEVLGVLLLVD